MNSIDASIQNYFLVSKHPLLSDFLYSLTILFDWSLYFWLIIITTSLIIFLTHGIRRVYLFILTLFFSTGIVYLLKHFLNVSRPPGGVIEALNPSFPSYHATISTVFFLLVMYIFQYNFQGIWRKLFNLAGLSFIVLVSFSRVYLGVHWLSDVLSGLLLGTLIFLISRLIFKKIAIILTRRGMVK